MSSVDLRPPGGQTRLRLGRSGSVLLHPRSILVTLVLVVAALAATTVTVTTGSLSIPVADLPAALLGLSEDARQVRVVQQIRLPRALAALAAGAVLGVAGAIFQSLSRNALGSPDVIGFTTGAATGAIAQIVLFQGAGLPIAVGTTLGGVVTAAAVLLLARRNGHLGGGQLVLVGIGVGAVFAALNSLLLVKGDLDSSIQANLWLSGSLDARTWEHAIPVLAATAVLIPAGGFLARRAELIELGDDLAHQLGVPVERTRLALVAIAVLLTAAATAAVGPIAFVALAAPQLARRLTRVPGLPIVSAAAMGAFLLTTADAVTQHLPFAFTVPIGRMTGIVGGLYLIWLLMPGRNRVRV